MSIYERKIGRSITGWCEGLPKNCWKSSFLHLITLTIPSPRHLIRLPFTSPPHKKQRLRSYVVYAGSQGLGSNDGRSHQICESVRMRQALACADRSFQVIEACLRRGAGFGAVHRNPSPFNRDFVEDHCEVAVADAAESWPLCWTLVQQSSAAAVRDLLRAR